MTPLSLAEAACQCLATADATEKAKRTQQLAQAWRHTPEAPIGTAIPPQRPGRPDRPQLLPPAQVPRRKINRGVAGRVALLHALAHIELNAIDLAWDIIARFAETDLPRAFVTDWLKVAEEEAKHFLMLDQRLQALGSHYGALPAHDGLWEAAQETEHDLLARLAVVPMVLEARGLDVTPAMIEKLRAVDDTASAEVLEIIYKEEIGHVATGQRWFAHFCQQRGLKPEQTFQTLVRRHFRGQLKQPFNVPARDEAGVHAGYYLCLANSA